MTVALDIIKDTSNNDSLRRRLILITKTLFDEVYSSILVESAQYEKDDNYEPLSVLFSYLVESYGNDKEKADLEAKNIILSEIEKYITYVLNDEEASNEFMGWVYSEDFYNTFPVYLFLPFFDSLLKADDDYVNVYIENFRNLFNTKPILDISDVARYFSCICQRDEQIPAGFIYKSIGKYVMDNVSISSLNVSNYEELFENRLKLFDLDKPKRTISDNFKLFVVEGTV